MSSPFMFSVALARRIARTRVPLYLRHYAAPPPSGLSDGERTIYSKLTERFSPSELEVQDISGGCGTFYHIVIASEAFKGIPMIKQHRLVNETLKKEIEGIHGLQLQTRTP
ncbi:bola-like protein [Laetiporus sulphureus 93-53]|uniref:Bola-like protein n=1 Tax=Laetiporus sulphureus 93-53 TaxID=1314785 RepID=A0A165IJ99_9APHY|nr:bola-like protein [Laetiporus sulphureus 93-53]KZT13155.1 bola-like protein [Laetiporus sulphureus 93-53]